MGRSLTVRVMEMLGFRHVPDKMVQVIERNGRFHRTSSRTFVRHWPFIENFGPQVRTGLYTVEQTCDNVLCRDGVLHNITISTKVFFDIDKVHPAVMAIVVQYPDTIVKSRVQSIVDMVLREEVIQQDSTNLLLPGIISQISNSIKKRLAKDLETFGASLPSDFIEDTLYIKEILPPKRMQENRTEATNINETVQNLTRLTFEEIKQAIVAHLYRDMGQHSIQVRAMNLPDAANPFKVEREADPPLRVLRQPTGRIYDN
ncbi:MAG: hypothetical protein HC875_25725 [Anaerolineales bacterium]|nr:hypothetical protein [Anaerolineales bacterium]